MSERARRGGLVWTYNRIEKQLRCVSAVVPNSFVSRYTHRFAVSPPCVKCVSFSVTGCRLVNRATVYCSGACDAAHVTVRAGDKGIS